MSIRTRNIPLHLMLLPGLLFVLVYKYVPMAGILIAFQRFIPAKGLFGAQEWVGWANFTYLFRLPDFSRVLWNTVSIAVMKIAANLAVPIVVSLMLNELRRDWLKRWIQTIIYLPHFLSWVILGGIFVDILSPTKGIVNGLIGVFGAKPVFFLGDRNVFPYVTVVTDVWQNYGYSTILYLAAISGINPSLYESAVIDGAGRWKQMRHITLPGMSAIIVVIATLALGRVLNAGFDQIFNLYSPVVYETGDILDTFVYRIGLVNAQYSLATAVGLFKSVISTALIVTSYWLAYRVAGYRIF